MSAPAHKTSFFPPPPAGGAPQGSYPAPPRQTPSPQPPYGSSGGRTSYPPPGGQQTIPIRTAETPESGQYPPPPATYEDQPGIPEETEGDEGEEGDAGSTAAPFLGASTTVDDVGTFNGGSYRISHRDCNTILTIQLAIGCPFNAKPGKFSLFSCSSNPRFICPAPVRATIRS